MNEQLKVIRDLMEDINLGSQGASTQYSVTDMEVTLREKMVELFGKANPTMQEVRRNANSGAFFALMEEFIGTYASETLASALPFAEIKNVAWGDKPVFEIENSDLFDVVAVAKGNGNVRRQRLENGYLTLATDAVAIKIFDNFKRFLSGRVKWAEMTKRVADSYVKEIKERIFTAFYGTAPVSGNATFNVADGGGFALQSVRDMVDHVQAENVGAEIGIVGTRQALLKLAPVVATDSANEEMYRTGYYTTAEGYKLIPIEQMHIKNSYTFLLSNKQLMIIPISGEGFVKVLEEGTPIIEDMPLNVNGDMSKEYLFYREVGVGVITGTKYGKYSWT